VTRPSHLAAALLTVAACAAGCGAGRIAPGVVEASSPAPPPRADAGTLQADLDRIFSAPPLARALMGVHIVSLADGRVLYARDADKRVVPASNMKLVTVAVAAERLGWGFTFRTRLEAAGAIDQGTLAGDLVVTGDGDPTISAQEGHLAPLFLEWADAARKAGIRRVAGRIVGDDNALDDLGLGAGWAWDYLEAGYAAPSGALTYNENIIRIAITPGASAGASARLAAVPAGHGLEIVNEISTGAQSTPPELSLLRAPGSVRLTVRGTVPAAGTPVIRTAAVPDPTRYFLEAFRLALAARGITVSGGVWDIDDLVEPPPSARRLLAERESAPLSSVAAHTLKVSQNLYGDTLLKTLGRTPTQAGSAVAGRQIVARTLAGWGVAPEAIVMLDGSGLSRYNYVTPDALTTMLAHIWGDDRLRGPFVAALPVGAHDGTLESRMKNGLLARRVQAKTGTISNVRALSGYLETLDGEKLVFSMIANHFTATSAEIDAIVEQALERVVRGQ
jgi:D-alanyl-D-alanine carboxypeptidase/D-alanyl-D-alanine-endopeptidase (penicillin-binding protein 4)